MFAYIIPQLKMGERHWTVKIFLHVPVSTRECFSIALYRREKHDRVTRRVLENCCYKIIDVFFY